MAKFSVNSFTSTIVGVVVGIILLVAVAIPIINANAVPTGTTNAAALTTIIGVIPILLGVTLILGVVYSFMRGRD